MVNCDHVGQVAVVVRFYPTPRLFVIGFPDANFAVDDVLSNEAVIFIDVFRDLPLGGDGGNIEDHGGVSPPGVQTDCGDDGEMCDRRDVGIYPSGGGSRSSRLIPHTGVHLETVGNHCGTGGI